MPSRWEAATRSWRRKVLHYPLPTLMYRNLRLPCTIELQPVSLMPLKMRKVQLASQLHGVLMLQSLAIVRQPVGHLVHDVGRYGSAVIHDGWPVEDAEGDLISERVAGVDAFYFVRHQRSLSPLVGFDIPPFSAKSPGGRGNPDSSCTGRTPSHVAASRILRTIVCEGPLALGNGFVEAMRFGRSPGNGAGQRPPVGNQNRRAVSLSMVYPSERTLPVLRQALVMRMQRTVEIDRRENLHIYQARPWVQPGEATCGATPRPGSLVDHADLGKWWYRLITYRGREYQDLGYVTRHLGEVRKVCGLCMSGGEPEDTE